MNKTIVNKLRSLREDIEEEFILGILKSGKLKEQPDIAKFKEKVEAYKNIKGDFYKYWAGAFGARGTPQGEKRGIEAKKWFRFICILPIGLYQDFLCIFQMLRPVQGGHL